MVEIVTMGVVNSTENYPLFLSLSLSLFLSLSLSLSLLRYLSRESKELVVHLDKLGRMDLLAPLGLGGSRGNQEHQEILYVI